VTADVEALQGGIRLRCSRSCPCSRGHCLTSCPAALSEPYGCPFAARCWPVLPAHHVSTLYLAKHRAQELEAQGYVTIQELPDGLGLNPQAERQRRARAGRPPTGRGRPRPSLESFSPPLAFLDFETVQFAIPLWDGCHPFDQVPAQFSCHRERPDGKLDHHEWAPEGPGDRVPRSRRRVVEACAGARAVVAYSAGFEKGCLDALANALPYQAAALRDVAFRLADLLPVVREHVLPPGLRRGASA